MRRHLIITVLAAVLTVPASGQMNWGLRTNIGLEKNISKGFDAGIDARYHQTDNFSSTDRWSVGLSLSKRLYRNDAKTFNVKAGLSYKYMKVYNGWSTKFKGDTTKVLPNGLAPQAYINDTCDFNYYDSYVDHRDRVSASLQASYEVGRFKISLRETYQFTYTDSASYAVDRYRSNKSGTDWAKKGYSKLGGGYYVKSEMDGKAGSGSNVLRSRLCIDYNIPHCKYDPFVSYELFNNIDEGFKAQKSRFTAGVDFTFKKKHNFEVAYMWQNQHDDDEPAGSFICLSYKFEL